MKFSSTFSHSFLSLKLFFYICHSPLCPFFTYANLFFHAGDDSFAIFEKAVNEISGFRRGTQLTFFMDIMTLKDGTHFYIFVRHFFLCWFNMIYTFFFYLWCFLWPIRGWL
jgi:hypothetical protein